MHVLDKNKKASGKESSDQQRLQQRLPEGTRAPMEPLEGRNIQDGLGKGREPWTWPLGKGERLDTHTFLLWLYFLSLSPGCSQKPTPRSLFPLTPGESGPRDQQAPSCLGVFAYLLYTFCGIRRSRATEGHSSDCLGLAFMPL